MAKFLTGLGAVIGAAALVFGIYGLLAWILSEGIAFVFGYDIGFWRTFVGMFLVSVGSSIVFSGLRTEPKS